MTIELDPTSSEEVLSNALEIATNSSVETSYFLLAGLLALTVGLAVGYILVKSIDRDQDPFVVFHLDAIKPVPLLASILVTFFVVIQVRGTAWKVFASEDPVSLADVALANAAATVGPDVACLVIFWGLWGCVGVLGGGGGGGGECGGD